MKKSVENSEHYKWGNDCDGWHLLKSDELGVISEKMPSGTSETLHYHNRSQQVFYILSGEATFEIEGETVSVKPNESIHIPPKTLHRISNETAAELTFLVISEPKSQGDRLEIIEYSDDLKSHVKTLNYCWLEKYFKVEAGDEKSLSNPKEEILDKGGSIYYVRKAGEIIATASLLKKANGDFELGKMAVSDNFQGLGIGQMLLKHCFNEAKKRGIPKLVLYSNTVLENAIYLYKKFGFVEIPLESGLYERANIKMEKIL
jgi:mannose-6-phosphate isomerase-like protein (cupin superfamily)/N-acetylglutamate synthase-like GNAT family acetyltransferase